MAGERLSGVVSIAFMSLAAISIIPRCFGVVGFAVYI